jgi:hypothetical protein
MRSPRSMSVATACTATNRSSKRGRGRCRAAGSRPMRRPRADPLRERDVDGVDERPELSRLPAISRHLVRASFRRRIRARWRAMLVPATTSIGMPFASSTCRTPKCAIPNAAPPPERDANRRPEDLARQTLRGIDAGERHALRRWCAAARASSRRTAGSSGITKGSQWLIAMDAQSGTQRLTTRKIRVPVRARGDPGAASTPYCTRHPPPAAAASTAASSVTVTSTRRGEAAYERGHDGVEALLPLPSLPSGAVTVSRAAPCSPPSSRERIASAGGVCDRGQRERFGRSRRLAARRPTCTWRPRDARNRAGTPPASPPRDSCRAGRARP